MAHTTSLTVLKPSRIVKCSVEASARLKQACALSAPGNRKGRAKQSLLVPLAYLIEASG